MGKLYELTGQIRELQEMIEQGEFDEEMLKDTLDGIDYEFELKAENYAKLIREIVTNSDALKSEIDRLVSKKTYLDNAVKSLKRSLQDAMLATGKTKFKTTLFSFGIQKNPPSLVFDSHNIPGQYLINKDPEPDKKAIKEELKKGTHFDFAHLEATESLRIR